MWRLDTLAPQAARPGAEGGGGRPCCPVRSGARTRRGARGRRPPVSPWRGAALPCRRGYPRGPGLSRFGPNRCPGMSIRVNTRGVQQVGPPYRSTRACPCPLRIDSYGGISTGTSDLPHPSRNSERMIGARRWAVPLGVGGPAAASRCLPVKGAQGHPQLGPRGPKGTHNSPTIRGANPLFARFMRDSQFEQP